MEFTMRKKVLTVFVVPLVTALTLQTAAASKPHHARTKVHAAPSERLLNSYASGAPQAYPIQGREVAAPPWSAACMTDHGPSQCDEPMWIYGSPTASGDYPASFYWSNANESAMTSGLAGH
jgi:hypothetical protein